jgi:hypothetical protein
MTVAAPVPPSKPVMPIPIFWKRFLVLVAIGKAAVAGAGVALAILGAMDIAFALSAKAWLSELKPYYLDVAAIGGGVVGASIRTVWAFLDAASARASVVDV